MLAEPAPSASVVIPVKDGARWLGEVLAAVLAQELGLEVLDIDSGSRDHCVDIARAAGVSVLEIEPASFGHGRTRNLGAQRTSGELVCFLTQDATPVPGCLAAHRKSHALSDRVGAVFGPHLPPSETSPMIARELTEFFAGFPTASTTRPSAPTSTPATSAPAGRRSASTTSPTRRTRRSLEPCAPPATGWEKAYNPRAGVLHAHDYPPITFMRRYFDEYRGLRVTAAQLVARRGGRPVPTARGAVDDAEQRTDGKAAAELQPGLEFVPAPRVHADLAAVRPCRAGPRASRGADRDRLPSVPALLGCAVRPAITRRSDREVAPGPAAVSRVRSRRGRVQLSARSERRAG